MGQVTVELLVLLGTIVGLFVWNRSESREDNRRSLDLLDAINKEIKDFHGRLCSLEEKSKKSN
jgi:hypothetical protein